MINKDGSLIYKERRKKTKDMTETLSYNDDENLHKKIKTKNKI